MPLIFFILTTGESPHPQYTDMVGMNSGGSLKFWAYSDMGCAGAGENQELLPITFV